MEHRCRYGGTDVPSVSLSWRGSGRAWRLARWA